MKLVAFLALSLVAATSAHAAVSVASIFTNHAVLQHGVPVAVWGKAEPGESVTVTYMSMRQSTKAGPDGKWKVTLPALKPRLASDLIIKGAANTVIFTDIVTGEVWLCSGQSNMGFPVSKSLNAEQEIAAANYPQIREFNVRAGAIPEPTDTAEGAWKVCTPDVAGSFYASAYFFGRDLSRALGDMPVGLIAAADGGTIIEAWTSRAAIDANPKLEGILQLWEKAAPNYAAAAEKYKQDVDDWRADSKAAGKNDFYKLPKLPPGAPNDRPGGLFNHLINPLIPYGIKGVVWYQGESNAMRSEAYYELCKTLIADWRFRWGEGDFPFLIMQLPRNLRAGVDPTGMTWAYLREAQAQLLDLPNVGLISTLDLGQTNEDHPPNKQDFGKRAAAVAVGLAYGGKEPWQAPVFKDAKLQGSSVLVTFAHTEGGLVTRDSKVPAGFQLAGTDKQFRAATAKIEGSAAVVSSPAVPEPKYIRYAFRNDPIEANLTSKSGLTVVPFRTDNIPPPKW